MSVRYRTCLTVCKDAKRGALYHKRTPLYYFFRALRGDFLRADDERHERRAGDAHQHARAERVGHGLGIAVLFHKRQAQVGRRCAGQRDGLDIADLAGDERQEDETHRLAQHVVQKRDRARDRVSCAGDDARCHRVPAEARADGEPFAQRDGGEERIDDAGEQRANHRENGHEHDAQPRAAHDAHDAAVKSHAEAHRAEHDAKPYDEQVAGDLFKALGRDELREDKIAQQHPADDHEANDDRGLDARGVDPAAVLLGAFFLCTGGQGVAVEVHDLARGSRAEHTADGGEQCDEQRLHADAAKARRHLLIRAHAQTHEEDEKIDEQIRQRVQKVKFVCMAAQLACNEVAGDHNGPVECEHCHEREPSFRRVAAKIEKGRRVIRAALCCFGRIGKYQARVLTQAEYLARFASRSCASAPLVRM